MTSAWSQLEQMLTCAICLDKFKNPRLLPCQHSFCGDACMEGLVDYARRQIKCPECRAEHRIPYQGVSSLPSNVTLIRFLELHSKITGEEPEPVPTFMEKCSVCGEKVDGVQRCWHCEKKVCPECKEAHLDLLRREITRINNQSKRCFGKMQEFKVTLEKSEERLKMNHKQVRHEIEDSCKRLIEDLTNKQKKLLEEVDSFAENEQKIIEKLKISIVDELNILDSNTKLAEEKISSSKYAWTDQELSEMKEIYARSMEFMRLFDPEIGDFTRKMRFNLIPEFDTLRRRIIELGELKFTETASSLIASSLQYCNATGTVAMELCNAAAGQAAAMAANCSGFGGYGLAHSNSNSNMGLVNSSSTMLELPSMQNALMRSQSDHRLANQFQQRLKQEQQARQQQEQAAKSNGRYGLSSAGRDYEADSLRSRYAPPRTAKQDYSSDLLTRDWPRPSDSDAPDVFTGSSIQFKSAFMRRREKERQQAGGAGYGGYDVDDDDLTSEASYGGASGRNVRFLDGGQAGVDSTQAAKHQVAKLFDVKECEHAPLSGIPKLEEAAHFQCRLHQMGAKAEVDKKRAEEEGQRDKDLIESAREGINKAKERKTRRQVSEDEIDKQKRTNQQQQRKEESPVRAERIEPPSGHLDTSTGMLEFEPDDLPLHSPVPVAEVNSNSNSAVEPVMPTTTLAANTASSHFQSPTSAPGNRRGLYGAAVTEKSKRQLSSAIQDAAAYTSARRRSGFGLGSSSNDGDQTPDTASSTGSGSTVRNKKSLRSSARSMSSRNNSIDDSGTTTIRRKRLVRADSNLNANNNTQQQQSDINSPSTSSVTAAEPSLVETSGSKNYLTGSGGQSTTTSASENKSSTSVSQTASQRLSSRSFTSDADQTATTTADDDDEPENGVYDAGRSRIPKSYASSSSTGRPSSRLAANSTQDSSEDTDDDDEDEDEDDDDGDGDDGQAAGKYEARNTGSRRSREMLPNAVNKLLDRSAQIRRDSQEARSRGDSPKQSLSNSRKDYYSSTSSSSSPRVEATSISPKQQSSFYSSSPATGSPASRRFAYQRSTSIRDTDDNETNNSNNSIYTTASSGASPNSYSSFRRKSSAEEDSTRRSSGNSTDRTVISSFERAPHSSSGRRDSSGDTPSAYQSRFLSRSRTSAAIQSGGSSSLAIARSQESGSGSQDAQELDSPRSYLSSRDRFMQSASVVSGSGSGSVTSGPSTTNASASNNLYSSRGSSAAFGLGQYRHQLPSKANYRDNSPFLDLDDDDDDQYSAYFPTGFKTRSEYLRNKFGQRRNSSNSSTSSALMRSKSSHAAFMNDSNDDDGEEETHFGAASHNPEDDSDRSDTEEAAFFERRRRRSSLAGGTTIRRSSFDNPTGRVHYGSKQSMLFKFGSRGSEAGNFTWPRGVAVGLGSLGREVVVADSSNHRVQIFDSNGKYLKGFGSYGSQDGEFDCLAGVSINRVNRNYIVSDRYNHRIQVFDMSGKFVRAFGEYGKDSGKFNLPWGVACDTSGLIYVCDKENHRIQVFDVDGTHLNKFGVNGFQSGQLQHPHYIAVGQSKIVVTDTNNHRVQIFDLSGRMINSFGKEGSQEGQFKFPRGVAMDEHGVIIVGDSGNNRLQIFNPEGVFIKSIGTWGSADGEFKGIEGVAVDTNNNILVCDRENHRIQVF